MSQKIILIGFMGVGKTSIGSSLADQLSVAFYDIDHLVESSCNKSIAEIFELEGEPFFRTLEFDLFKQSLMQNTTAVIATGGGLAMHPEFYTTIAKHSSATSIYLRLNVQDLCKRLAKEKQHRPLIRNLTLKQLKRTVSDRLSKRRSVYNQADVAINVKGKTIPAIVDRIRKLLV